MWNQGGYSETAMVGGYTQSPGGFASPTASQGGEKKGRTRATQIIPCTVSQLMSATQVEEAFKVGDVEVTQVTIVGIIRSTDKSMTNIQYKVDDMTGAPMDVKQWVDTEDPSMDTTVLPPGTYVKVSGNLRSFQNHRSVVAFSVRPLEDMNEITSHILEVVHAHMALSKPQTMVRRHSLTVSRLRNDQGGSCKSGGAAGIHGCPQSKFKFVLACVNFLFWSRSSATIKTCFVYLSLRCKRQAVEFLSNEGHIFSTIDEDHFKSTDSED
uniref:Replication protein A2 n=1 Tax=Fundulus heteroclitus TaxID=8078 RepID=A0A3Q2Q5Y2_FUNHE